MSEERVERYRIVNICAAVIQWISSNQCIAGSAGPQLERATIVFVEDVKEEGKKSSFSPRLL